ncbi:MAG: copper chaperone PCu(A)C, partial [Campylobacteraceae bacterium]|nr:copper chaperone PCu(A)C [Campylobacteraceae bacterium]
IMNKSSNDIQIVGAKSSLAKMVQVHSHTKVNGMTKMGHVKTVNLKAKSTFIFQPGGYHVMFMGMKKRLKEGEMADFTLIFSDGSELNINAPVKRVMAGMKHDKTSIHKKMSGMNNSDMKK